jgi:hypothetical protein
MPSLSFYLLLVMLLMPVTTTTLGLSLVKIAWSLISDGRELDLAVKVRTK